MVKCSLYQISQLDGMSGRTGKVVPEFENGLVLCTDYCMIVDTMWVSLVGYTERERERESWFERGRVTGYGVLCVTRCTSLDEDAPHIGRPIPQKNSSYIIRYCTHQEDANVKYNRCTVLHNLYMTTHICCSTTLQGQ